MNPKQVEGLPLTRWCCRSQPRSYAAIGCCHAARTCRRPRDGQVGLQQAHAHFPSAGVGHHCHQPHIRIRLLQRQRHGTAVGNSGWQGGELLGQRATHCLFRVQVLCLGMQQNEPRPCIPGAHSPRAGGGSRLRGAARARRPIPAGSPPTQSPTPTLGRCPQ